VSRRRAARAEAPSGCTVTVCRGCCCGTSKHPDVDHAGQVAALRAGVPGGGRLRLSDCLDVCERSNVVVVSPSAAGRRAGGRPVWLGEVLHADVLDAVLAWVGAGGPGLTDPPADLGHHVFSPSRRVRQAVDG
jgi:(2Fe-2S) ferredoxin